MRKSLSLLGALAVAAPALAQQPPQPPSSESDIVVEGTRSSKKQVDDFVRSLTIAPSLGQISRFHWAVCPAAVGLPERHNRQVAERMRAVAAAAGIRVGKADCVANSIVIVTDDRRELLKALDARYPAYFHSVHRLKALVEQRGPAVAWHVEGLVDSQGQAPVGASRSLGGGFGGPGAHVDVTESMDGGRLKTPSAKQFVAAVLVLDRQGLAGLTTTQVADYAAMRLFARTDPAKLKASSPSTILKVLDAPMGAVTPVTLTAWDFGYLKALYASDPRQLAQQQRSEIGELMAHEVLPKDKPK